MSDKVKAVITDIEGTITPLAFVQDVLFPYSRSKMKDFIMKGYEDNPRVLYLVDEIISRVKSGDIDGISHDIDPEDQVLETQLYTAVQVLITWIQQDVKEPILKEIQGIIWQEGYKKGDFQGLIYADAFAKLKELHERGTKLFVYSSGSVQAQKLLFQYSEFGDITYLFDGYFDTKLGPKKETGSYLKILETIGYDAQYVDFWSDSIDELKAAQKAGLNTLLLRRKEDYPDWTNELGLDFEIINGF